MVVGIVDRNELIFNIHKEDIIEDTIRYKKNLRQKYDLDAEEIHDMFARIVNYQIDRYGSQKQKFVQILNKEEYLAKSQQNAQRKYMRTRYR